MKKFKKALLTILIIGIFTLSCVTLGANRNAVSNNTSAKSKEIMVSGYLIDPPPVLLSARSMM